jgi:competence protein ComEA
VAGADRTPGLAMLAAGFIGGAATIGLIWSVSTRPVAVPAPPQTPPPVRTLAPIERTPAAPVRTTPDPVRTNLAAARAPEPEETPPAPQSEETADAPIEVAADPTPNPDPAPPSVESTPPDPATTRIRINTATAAELDLLPGIGPALAARIIESRRVDGPFGGLEDLQRVRGIGPKTAENIAPLVRFD